jgi:1,4-alpha-glucan branching enzyme
VRHLLDAVGMWVDEFQIDGLRLDDLPIGKWRYLTAQEIQRITGGDTRE